MCHRSDILSFPKQRSDVRWLLKCRQELLYTQSLGFISQKITQAWKSYRSALTLDTLITSVSLSRISSLSFSLDLLRISSRPPLHLLFLSECFPPSFWYATFLFSQGCYGDVSFYILGASSSVIFFFPLFPFLLSFIFCFRLAANSMQTGAAIVFPEGLGWRSCRVFTGCLPLWKCKGVGGIWQRMDRYLFFFFLFSPPMWPDLFCSYLFLTCHF